MKCAYINVYDKSIISSSAILRGTQSVKKKVKYLSGSEYPKFRAAPYFSFQINLLILKWIHQPYLITKSFYESQIVLKSYPAL